MNLVCKSQCGKQRKLIFQRFQVYWVVRPCSDRITLKSLYKTGLCHTYFYQYNSIHTIQKCNMKKKIWFTKKYINWAF